MAAATRRALVDLGLCLAQRIGAGIHRRTLGRSRARPLRPSSRAARCARSRRCRRRTPCRSRGSRRCRCRRAGRRRGTRARPRPRGTRARASCPQAAKARDLRARAPRRHRRARVPEPDRITNSSSSALWQWRGYPSMPGAMVMWRRPLVRPPAATPRRRETKRRPGRSKSVPGDVVAVHDPARARRDLSGHRERPGGRLACKRVAGRDGVLDPGGAGPHHAGARQVADLGRPPLPEREHVHRLVARDQRVRTAAREVHQAVAGTHLVRLPRAPRQAAAGQDVEDLLLGTVIVRRGGPGAGLEAQAVEPDRDRAGGVPEVLPERVDVAVRGGVALRGRVVPVCEVLHLEEREVAVDLPVRDLRGTPGTRRAWSWRSSRRSPRCRCGRTSRAGRRPCAARP